jgi:diaminopimelate epimerase
MKVIFEKYQGNGNDFIIIDDRDGLFPDKTENVKKLCDRHFGIGADGLMLVKKSDIAEFEMVYYNSDGNISTMCGNGGRCIAAYAFKHGIAKKKMNFIAIDGLHKAAINNSENKNLYDVSLQMTNVDKVIKEDEYYFINTGSPHHITFVKNVKDVDVYNEGKKIRYGALYSPQGTNVNFVQLNNENIIVKTYERGVEDETLSCGTGVTASAIAAYLKTGKKIKKIKTTGGDFSVNFEENNGKFVNVTLNGPAEMVFKGEIEI